MNSQGVFGRQRMEKCLVEKHGYNLSHAYLTSCKNKDWLGIFVPYFYMNTLVYIHQFFVFFFFSVCHFHLPTI